MVRRCLALAAVLLSGCSGYHLEDVSADPAPEVVVSSRPLGARAVIAARSIVHIEPDEPDLFFADRSRLAAAHAAVECAKLLCASHAFNEAVPRELTAVRRAGDVELSLTEDILAAPRFEIGPRRLVVGVLYLSLLFPVAIPLDAIYMQRLPGVEARYTLELRDERGAPTARFETVATIAIEEQACASERDLDYPWLAHGPALRLARDRALRALVAKLVAHEAGRPR